jgi:polysaccharide biosynthesis protein PslJ
MDHAAASPAARLAPPALIAGAVALLIFAVLADTQVKTIAGVVIVVAIFAASYRWLLRWQTLVVTLIGIVLFVPIKRYKLPGHLPFDLELYRVFVSLLVVGWLAALLIDPRVRARRSGLEGPILAIVVIAIASELANASRAASLINYVVKSLTFLASFILIVYLIVSVVRTRAQIDAVVRWLVTATAIVAFFGLVERRTHYNVFDHLSTVFPFLQFEGGASVIRSGHLRIVGSSQHPIALGAAFVLILPLAIYLARATRRRRWVVATLVILAGAFATGSRTAMIMLLALVVVYLALRPRETRRLWPALLPAVLLIHIAAPGALGSLREQFSPQGGLIAQQDNHKNNAKDAQLANGRIADLGPAFHNELAPDPALGEGYGTRLTGYTETFTNAPILDDQWLGSLLETGVFGVVAWLWLFGRAVRRLARAGKADQSDDGWLFVSLAASVASFAAGMFFYDAFSFIQVTFLLYIVLALGMSALRFAAGTRRSGLPRLAGLDALDR